MTVLLGRVCLGVALLGTLATVAGGWQVARDTARGGTADSRAALWLRRGPAVTFGALLAAFGVLEWALLTDDFSVRYVMMHHSRATPTLFTVTSAWAGLEGSLLLWALVIAAYLWVVARGVRRRSTGDSGRDIDANHDSLGAGALAVMGVIAAFFVALVLMVAPTFNSAPPGTTDGRGANPLLQDNMLMAVHPPLLYLGYVGFMVPFAFAVAALALRVRGPQWVLRTQTWAVVAWAFLTAGIVIGGWWSYDVLGWGGYWAWDPVENASFLPWLVGTGYLHSAVMQARRGMLPAWSVGLVISSFLFTLLGTFLARSGVIASVHAFSQSSLGPVLLVFLLCVTAVVVWLFVTRLRDVVTGPPLQSLASREGVFLLNNLLLATFAVVVLVGTVYPIVVEAVNGDRISVGRPFFDVFAVWISLALMLAMCVGVVTPYRRARWGELWAHQRLPVQVGLGFAAALVVLAGLRAPYVIVVAALAGTIVATAVRELARDVRARVDRGGRRAAVRAAAGGALRAKPGFWGGQVAHVGLAVLALGIAASSNLAERSTVTLEPGQTAVASGFTVTYVRPTAAVESHYSARGALLRVERGGNSSTVEPRSHQYPNQREPIGKPAVWTTPRGEDAYVALLAIDERSVTFHLYRYPWMVLVWTGGLLMAAGGVVGLVLRGMRRRADRAVSALVGESGEPDVESVAVTP